MSKLAKIFTGALMLLPFASLAASQLAKAAEEAPITHSQIDPGEGQGGSGWGLRN